MAAKLAVTWQDHGDFIRVYADVFPRRNGLPNTGAMDAALRVLSTVNPDAFDPPEPVPESVARAAVRDLPTIGMPHVEMTGDDPPLPVFEEDEIPGPRCAAGFCPGD